eukprot:2563330-Pleurochrysis_carterae.AAC.1
MAEREGKEEGASRKDARLLSKWPKGRERRRVRAERTTAEDEDERRLKTLLPLVFAAAPTR